MTVLPNEFTATAGDFLFSCERDEATGTIYWFRTLLNFAGAKPEQVGLLDVPPHVLAAYAAARTAKLTTLARNQAAAR